MMNDAMRATVDMVVAAVKARGYEPFVREELHTVTVFLEEDQSRFAGFSYKVATGDVTVYESGRWSERRTAGVELMMTRPELEARRFRRAA
jgi:hypothetical protein